MKIPFFKPEMSRETLKAVETVLRNGWLTTGPKTLEFEKKFGDYIHSANCIMVNSGTAALHLALEAINIGPGDEIITTPFTFAATTEAIEYMGAKPVFVDIRKDTLNMDENLIEDKITSKTKAIIPVHFAGIPCEMKKIMGLAKKYEIKVIEDAAHCTPAYYGDKAVGSIGDITCFSFYANKCITTGEGGMIAVKNKKLADKIKLLRLHGMSRDAINRYKSANWEYDISVKGYKYNPTDISAVIGIHQLKKANSFLKSRTKIAAQYTRLLSPLNFITALKIPRNITPSWYIYPIRIEKKEKNIRNQLIEYLYKNGISTSVHFKPVPMLSYYKKKYGFKSQDFPIAHGEFLKTLTLPVYPSLQSREVKFIVEKIANFFNKL